MFLLSLSLLSMFKLFKLIYRKDNWQWKKRISTVKNYVIKEMQAWTEKAIYVKARAKHAQKETIANATWIEVIKKPEEHR